MTTTISGLLKDSAYKLGQFKPEQIAALEAAITVKDAGKRPSMTMRDWILNTTSW